MITYALANINFGEVFFLPLGTADINLRINGLQVAAKLHEVTLIASLSIVAVDFVQYELLRGKGLAINGIVSAFQLTNLMTLWSRGFWNKCFTTGFRRRRIRFLLLILWLMIMTLILGPASSILMLPTVGWWHIPKNITVSVDGAQGTVAFSLYGNESVIWPSHITTTNYNLTDCTLVNPNDATTLPLYCPAAGLPLMLAQAWNTENLTSWRFDMPSTESTSTAPVFNRGIQGIVSGDDGVALTKSTASSINNALTTIISTTNLHSNIFPNSSPTSPNDKMAWNVTLQNGSQILQPQTFVLCDTTYTHIDDWDQPPQPAQQLSFKLRGGQTISIDGSPLMDMRKSNTSKTAALWIEPPYMTKYAPSILFAVAGDMPYDARVGNRTWYYTSELVTCSIYASWSAGDISATLDSNDLSIGSSTISDDLAYWSKWRGTGWSGGLDNWEMGNTTDTVIENVQLDVGWANIALPPALTVVPLIDRLSSRGYKIRAAAPAVSLLVNDASKRLIPGVLSFSPSILTSYSS